jgi:hypothetical protein
LAARLPFLILAVVGVCVSAAVTAVVAGDVWGHALFLGSGLLGGLSTAWLIGRMATQPLSLFLGAIGVAFASLAAQVIMVYVLFAITGAGD